MKRRKYVDGLVELGVFECTIASDSDEEMMVDLGPECGGNPRTILSPGFCGLFFLTETPHVLGSIFGEKRNKGRASYTTNITISTDTGSEDKCVGYGHASIEEAATTLYAVYLLIKEGVYVRV